MPDLTLQSYSYCSDQEDFRFSIKDYDIRYGRTTPGLYQYNWSCTCKGFKFRKTCKHVKEAEKSLCKYDEFIDNEKPVDGKCPKCGKKTLTRLVGV